MQTALQEYSNRRDELEIFIKFVVDLDTSNVSLTPPPNTASELVKTLRATCYLLIYNLIESTIRNAVEGFFDELAQNGTTIDDCTEKLQLQILKLWKSVAPKNLVPITVAAQDMVRNAFTQAGSSFSGNIDARQIRKISRDYGISDPLQGTRADLLLEVKNKRNDLAHGIKSFAEVGRDVTCSDITLAFDQAKNALEATLQTFDLHIKNDLYKKAP